MFFLLFIDESLCKCTFETLLRLLLKKICIINLFVCPVFELDYLVHRWPLQTSPATLGDTARSKVKVNVSCVAPDRKMCRVGCMVELIRIPTCSLLWIYKTHSWAVRSTWTDQSATDVSDDLSAEGVRRHLDGVMLASSSVSVGVSEAAAVTEWQHSDKIQPQTSFHWFQRRACRGSRG